MTGGDGGRGEGAGRGRGGRARNRWVAVGGPGGRGEEVASREEGRASVGKVRSGQYCPVSTQHSLVGINLNTIIAATST